MPRANKRDTEIRAMLETISAEVAIIRRTLPVHRLRVEQARVRTGLDGLLSPALAEVDEVSTAAAEIGEQVRAALERLTSA